MLPWPRAIALFQGSLAVFACGPTPKPKHQTAEGAAFFGPSRVAKVPVSSLPVLHSPVCTNSLLSVWSQAQPSSLLPCLYLPPHPPSRSFLPLPCTFPPVRLPGACFVFKQCCLPSSFPIPSSAFHLVITIFHQQLQTLSKVSPRSLFSLSTSPLGSPRRLLSLALSVLWFFLVSLLRPPPPGTFESVVFCQ